uniref:Uncharacterized protein n=1 Tax=Knipowitschia caucasica TaxID=637954 RepID=A0AAV2IWT9_KNICA
MVPTRSLSLVLKEKPVSVVFCDGVDQPCHLLPPRLIHIPVTFTGLCARVKPLSVDGSAKTKDSWVAQASVQHVRLGGGPLRNSDCSPCNLAEVEGNDDFY